MAVFFHDCLPLELSNKSLSESKRVKDPMECTCTVGECLIRMSASSRQCLIQLWSKWE